jgi:hypothetical protein
VILRLAQHALIWLAASAVIVAGMTWASALGFNGHHPQRWPAGLLVATVTLIFAAALVQRAATAIVALTLLAAAAALVGVSLLIDGAVTAGSGYIVLGVVYLVALGPSSLRWLRDR